MGPFAPRDIALIFLTLHALIACVIPIALFFIIVRGALALNQKTRATMPTVQRYSRIMTERTEEMSQRVVEPVLKAHSLQSKLAAMVERAGQPLRATRGRRTPRSAADASSSQT